MFREILQSLRCLVAFVILTGVLYPLLINSIGQFFWPEKSQGTLIYSEGKVIGSELIAQKFTSDRYFHSRPSAADFATIPSGASNLAPTSKALKETVQERVKIYGEHAPLDLLTASGSGLDPHLSPDAVLSQLDRVARSRGITDRKLEELKNLVNSSIEEPTFGFMGKRRINVLKLNIELDRSFK